MSTTDRPAKPLGIKAYGSIGHLPNSRMGPGDHHVTEGQARIATEKKRDRHDVVIVQEKLDGSCTAVVKINGQILPLGRAGYLAWTSRFEMHRLFAQWVAEREGLFQELLGEGERLVGEWLHQAHGTRYALPHDPWVAFDLMIEHERTPYEQFQERVGDCLPTPYLVSTGEPLSVEDALRKLGPRGFHGALETIEGAVWRVERRGKVDFLAKYVRPEKRDGIYLPGISEAVTEIPIWNSSTWTP